MTLLVWIAVVGSVVGAWANTEGLAWCWPVWAVCDAVFLARNLALGEWAQAVVWAVNLAIAAKGMRRWK